MRISWSEDYAVMFMDTLAQNFDKRLVALSEVAAENHISFSFLKQLAMLLKKRGLIKSKEGVRGGYKLAKSPVAITLLDIISAINPHYSLTMCYHGANGSNLKCPKEDFCRPKTTWQKINQEIFAKLASVKLSQL